MTAIFVHPDADPAILAALVEREDVIIMDRLPRWPAPGPTLYTNGTATARHVGVDWATDADTDRDVWNARIEAEKTARRARRAQRKQEK